MEKMFTLKPGRLPPADVKNIIFFVRPKLELMDIITDNVLRYRGPSRGQVRPESPRGLLTWAAPNCSTATLSQWGCETPWAGGASPWLRCRGCAPPCEGVHSFMSWNESCPDCCAFGDRRCQSVSELWLPKAGH